MGPPELVKSIIRSIRLSPSMMAMISDEASKRRMNFSDYIRYAAISVIRSSGELNGRIGS
jgi:hypothetical protein